MSNLLKVQAAEAASKQQSTQIYSSAQDFFHSTPLVFAARDATAPTPESYASDQGTVQFHLIGQKPQDPAFLAFSGIMNENANNLLAIVGLVFAYMDTHYPMVSSQKLDIKTWQHVVGKSRIWRSAKT